MGAEFSGWFLPEREQLRSTTSVMTIFPCYQVIPSVIRDKNATKLFACALGGMYAKKCVSSVSTFSHKHEMMYTFSKIVSNGKSYVTKRTAHAFGGICIKIKRHEERYWKWKTSLYICLEYLQCNTPWNKQLCQQSI